MPIFPFPTRRPIDPALREQARIGAVIERIEQIWSDPYFLFSALIKQGIALDMPACEALSDMRGRLRLLPAAEDGDYRAALRDITQGFDRHVTRAAALDYDNDPIDTDGGARA